MAEYMAGRGTTALGIVGTVLGSIGTAAATGLNLGGNQNAGCGWGYDRPVNHYESALSGEVAMLRSEVALRDANVYSDQKMLDMYRYVDNRMRGIEGQLAQQAVINAQTTANLACMQKDISTLMGLTKTVIPIGNICPQPMERYNSWEAPTTETAPATGG